MAFLRRQQTMRTKRALLLFMLHLATPPLFASAFQYVSNATCNFTFSQGDVPNFQLPEAGPNSPGDVQLNEGNLIVTFEAESKSRLGTAFSNGYSVHER